MDYPDQMALAAQAQEWAAKLAGPPATPAPVPGFSFDPVKGHRMVVRGRGDPAGRAAFQGGAVSVRLLGGTRMAMGIAIKFQAPGSPAPWWRVTYAWHREAGKVRPLAGLVDVRLLPDSARRLEVIMIDEAGEVIAARALVLDRGLAWRLNDLVAIAVDNGMIRPEAIDRAVAFIDGRGVGEAPDPRTDFSGQAVDAP
jgi:hypothetical protein